MVATLEFKRATCKGLCDGVWEVDFESLEATASRHGLTVQHAWRAPNGKGFKAAAARLIVDAEDVLVVAFRATFGTDEWYQYTQRYWKRKFLPRDGENAGTTFRVFTVWNETLDETWTVPGEEVDGTADTLRGLIWRQLNAGNRVWLTGHSKGGAVATTAASRLLLGDCVVDSELPDPAVRRPEGRMVSVVGSPLSRLSVFTFNAPMSFARPLAALYDAILARVRGEHVRFEHRADRVRKLPPGGEMVHVGERQLEGEGVLEDPGVLAGGAVAIGGMAIALILAAFKITKSH